MAHAMHRLFGPLATMNRRMAIGGGVLCAILIAEGAIALVTPLT